MDGCERRYAVDGLLQAVFLNDMGVESQAARIGRYPHTTTITNNATRTGRSQDSMALIGSSLERTLSEMTVLHSGHSVKDPGLRIWVDNRRLAIPNISGWCSSEFDPFQTFVLIQEH